MTICHIQLAKLLKSSQSRVAKMEKGDPTVSVDLLVTDYVYPELAEMMMNQGIPFIDATGNFFVK